MAPVPSSSRPGCPVWFCSHSGPSFLWVFLKYPIQTRGSVNLPKDFVEELEEELAPGSQSQESTRIFRVPSWPLCLEGSFLWSISQQPHCLLSVLPLFLLFLLSFLLSKVIVDSCHYLASSIKKFNVSFDKVHNLRLHGLMNAPEVHTGGTSTQ